MRTALKFGRMMNWSEVSMDIKLGKVFFGESMFSNISNASRYAFIKYTDHLKQEGIELIDCQVYTEYLESFGARMITGKEFKKLLNTAGSLKSHR